MLEVPGGCREQLQFVWQACGMSGWGFHRKEILEVAADHGVAAGGIGENPGPQQWWRTLSVLRATGVVPRGEGSPAVTNSWSLLAVARGVPPEEGKCSHHPTAELSFCPPELEYYAAVAGQDARGTASPDPGFFSAQRSMELARVLVTEGHCHLDLLADRWRVTCQQALQQVIEQAPNPRMLLQAVVSNYCFPKSWRNPSRVSAELGVRVALTFGVHPKVVYIPIN